MIGRINIIKMNIMPRLFYLFQTLPVKFPLGFLRDLRSRFTKFIWAGKSARLRRDILTLPKDRGGVGLPDPVSYYEAAHLARVVEWCALQRTKPWILMEQKITKIPLEGLAWIQEVDIPQEVKKHPTIGATIRVMKRKFRKTKISEHVSPLVPVLGNPRFQLGLRFTF